MIVHHSRSVTKLLDERMATTFARIRPTRHPRQIPRILEHTLTTLIPLPLQPRTQARLTRGAGGAWGVRGVGRDLAGSVAARAENPDLSFGYIRASTPAQSTYRVDSPLEGRVWR